GCSGPISFRPKLPPGASSSTGTSRLPLGRIRQAWSLPPPVLPAPGRPLRWQRPAGLLQLCPRGQAPANPAPEPGVARPAQSTETADALAAIQATDGIGSCWSAHFPLRFFAGGIQYPSTSHRLAAEGAMAKRRRFVWVVAVCAALAIGLGACLWLTRPGPVRLANHRGIRGGRTLADVEGILGGPSGDYSSAPGQTRFRLNVKHERPQTWISDKGIVIVGFDAEGRVGAYSVLGPDLTTPDLLDRLRAWLGW